MAAASPDELKRLEAVAEKAYDAMYDARGREVKDCYELACECLIQAIDIAKRLGLGSERNVSTRGWTTSSPYTRISSGKPERPSLR